ncbi:MAG: FIST N-terminal domain-containing protein [Minicystis sp.]
METLIATALAAGDAESAAHSLARDVRAQLGGVEPVLLVAFASTKQPLGEIARHLRAAFPRATLLSASTAGEFTEATDAKGHAAVFALAGDYRVFAGMGSGLAKDVEGAVRGAVGDLPVEVAEHPHRTAILLLDPIAGMSEEATLIAASYLGEGVRLAGGAAGDDLAMKQTFVGCGERVASDAVVAAVIFSKQPLGLGVCHGHEPLSRPLRVTKASGATVFEIEGRPAWQVWEEETRASAAARGLQPEADIGAFLLRYEAGLSSGDAYKIRAPLSRGADGSISFACGIPEGTVIRITQSDPAHQIDSARTAAKRARAQLGDGKVAGALVFDCICRNLILGPDFVRAAVAIADELGGVRLAGFETYGEIALDAGDMSGFHNTTSVVLAFPR